MGWTISLTCWGHVGVNLEPLRAHFGPVRTGSDRSGQDSGLVRTGQGPDQGPDRGPGQSLGQDVVQYPIRDAGPRTMFFFVSCAQWLHRDTFRFRVPRSGPLNIIIP